MNVRVFFHQREIKWRWETMEDFAFWVSTHTKEGDEVFVILDGPTDDDNVLEIWVGSEPPEGIDARTEYAQAEAKKKHTEKGGSA